MSANASSFDNPLTAAARELDEVSLDRKLLPSPIDTGSLRRMVVHITNINHSVLASTRDHLNAAKRLNDFALTLTRIARKSEPPDGELAARLASAADNLRSASDELTSVDAVPNWESPARDVG
jgi:hypothetical protein